MNIIAQLHWDIKELLIVFYTLEEMWAYVSSDKYVPFFKSRQIFYNELADFRNKFNSGFAKIMYDYMLYVILEELVDSCKYAEESYSLILGSNPKYLSHSTIAREYTKIDPEDLLSRANEVFADGHWYGLFGGEAWAKAVNYTRLYRIIPNEQFLDNLIDLQHNTDSVLSKENPYWDVKQSVDKQLVILLNHKNEKDLWISYNYKSVTKFPRILKDLVTKFNALYVPEWKYRTAFHAYYWDFGPDYLDEIIKYKPTEYSYEYILGELCFSDDLDDSPASFYGYMDEY